MPTRQAIACLRFYMPTGALQQSFIWSPLIKATRIWGANSTQIKAFGLLEGGRGIVGAMIGTMAY